MTSAERPASDTAESPWNDLSELLEAAQTGNEARDRLVTQLYPELKRLAEAQMRRERPDHTLQATALVSEFFMQIARNPPPNARTRVQFLAVAAQAMRNLMVDYARARNRDKRGGDYVRVDLEQVDAAGAPRIVDVEGIDELLSRLAQKDPRMARIVELRFFGGLTMKDIADVLDVTERTVKRDWQIARAWFFGQLNRDDSHGAR